MRAAGGYSHYLMPAAMAADARLRVLVLTVGVAAMCSPVLGVDSFAGRPSGAALDLFGSTLLTPGVGAGLLATARLRSAPRVRAG